jgi:hypothetical protein
MHDARSARNFAMPLRQIRQNDRVEAWKTAAFPAELGCGVAARSYLMIAGTVHNRAETGQFAVWWRQNPVFMMIFGEPAPNVQACGDDGMA